MKHFKYLILLIIPILWSCSGGSDAGVIQIPIEVNKAPTTPILEYPTNNLLCINNEVPFRWSFSEDAEGDAISYQIDISKDIQFSEISNTVIAYQAAQTFTLDKGQAYYWRVKAIDSKKASSKYSSIFSFYTEGVGLTNHLPFAPELVYPLQNAVEHSGDITLEWNGNDTDNDPLQYDIYFGIDNPPTTKVSENQSETTFKVNTVSSVDYYWKIVVKDDKGGESIGQVWNFSTN